MPTFGSLFAGIGGIDLGLERAGWTGRWQVEWDEFCQRVLAKHWPNIPRYGDITTIDWSTVEPVDLIAGGFPCQPFSLAGQRRGKADDRWLWPAFASVTESGSLPHRAELGWPVADADLWRPFDQVQAGWDAAQDGGANGVADADGLGLSIERHEGLSNLRNAPLWDDADGRDRALADPDQSRLEGRGGVRP